MYGWAGQTENSEVWGTVREVGEEISLHTIDKVLKIIHVWSMTNEYFFVGQTL